MTSFRILDQASSKVRDPWASDKGDEKCPEAGCGGFLSHITERVLQDV